MKNKIIGIVLLLVGLTILSFFMGPPLMKIVKSPDALLFFVKLFILWIGVFLVLVGCAKTFKYW